jgi:hypothetical protein
MPEVQELPKYVCHKEVQAIKIKSVEWSSLRSGHYTITPFESGIEPITVTAEWQDKHGAKSGGYFVRYKDGYESFSPARAFEEGYTAVQS